MPTRSSRRRPRWSRARPRANAALALAACRQGRARARADRARQRGERSRYAAADAIDATRRARALRCCRRSRRRRSGAQPEVTEKLSRCSPTSWAAADDELIPALDQPLDVAQKTIIAACGRLGARGVGVLIGAARNERTGSASTASAGSSASARPTRPRRSRCSATSKRTIRCPMCGRGEAGVARGDRAREASRGRSSAEELPDFEARKLSTSELAEHEAAIDGRGDALRAERRPPSRADQRGRAASAVKGAAVGARGAGDRPAHARQHAARSGARPRSRWQARARGTRGRVGHLVGALGDGEGRGRRGGARRARSFGDAAGLRSTKGSKRQRGRRTVAPSPS